MLYDVELIPLGTPTLDSSDAYALKPSVNLCHTMQSNTLN